MKLVLDCVPSVCMYVRACVRCVCNSIKTTGSHSVLTNFEKPSKTSRYFETS